MRFRSETLETLAEPGKPQRRAPDAYRQYVEDARCEHARRRQCIGRRSRKVMNCPGEQYVVKVLRVENEAFFVRSRRQTGGIAALFRGFGNEELAEKNRSRRGMTFTTGC